MKHKLAIHFVAFLLILGIAANAVVITYCTIDAGPKEIVAYKYKGEYTFASLAEYGQFVISMQKQGLSNNFFYVQEEQPLTISYAFETRHQLDPWPFNEPVTDHEPTGWLVLIKPVAEIFTFAVFMWLVYLIAPPEQRKA